MGNKVLYFTIFTCLFHTWVGSAYASVSSGDQQLWKHVVTVDRLAWKERESEKKVNDLVSEEHFIRRIYLDITGKIPTFEQIRNYSQSKDLLKRQKLIDQLLNSKGYVSHLTNFWRDLLRHQGVKNIKHNEFTRYLERSVFENKPYDVMVREMLLAKGTQHENPAIGYYMRDELTDPMDTFNATVRAFLGVRIGCAQCHNHRFDKWTQKEFYESASFLWGLGCGKYIGNGESEVHGTHAAALKKDKRFMDLGNSFYISHMLNPSKAVVKYHKDPTLYFPDNYKYDNAKPGEKVKPRIVFDYGDAKLKGESYREQFANWMTSDENPPFARIMANRLWKRVMGVSLLDPIDDWKDNILIQNPLLFDALGEIMVEVKYDIKAFLRVIFNSEAYQYSFNIKNDISQESYKVQGATLRRMSAEQLSDSLLTLRHGNLDKFARLDGQYFEFEDKLYEVLQEYVDTVKPMLTAHAKKYMRNTDLTDPEILDYMLKTAEKIRELEEYYNINKKGYIKGYDMGEFTPLVSNVASDEGIMMMSSGDGSQSHDEINRMVHRAHFKGSGFMNDFGKLDRSSPETSIDSGSSLKQILLMMNSSEVKSIAYKDSYLMKELNKIESLEKKVQFLYYSIYGRAPQKKELLIAKKFIEESKHKGAWSDYTLALINSPEFYFIK